MSEYVCLGRVHGFGLVDGIHFGGRISLLCDCACRWMRQDSICFAVQDGVRKIDSMHSVVFCIVSVA